VRYVSEDDYPMSLFNELKRRNVFRVGIAYLAGAWLLIEVAGTLFPAFGIPDWSIRFMVIVFALGFVPALVFSWVYELTPEGLKREKDVVREVSTTHLTAKRLDLFTIGLIVAAVAFILTDRMWLSPSHEEQLTAPAEVVTSAVQTSGAEPQYPSNSIAVLPFVNMSDDAANEYFSDGISEELLNLLAKIPELRVIARTSSFSYKGKDVKVADLARELKVRYVLEGSVRKSGRQVRITSQLIAAQSETHLWSETYDRTLDDIFAIQDEIAAKVVARLKITLLGDAPKSEETDPEAYTLYLQARNLDRRGTSGDWEQSNALYQRALAIDPNYATAWSGLANNYVNQAGWGLLPLDEGHTLARETANRALAIDPDYAPAHAILSSLAQAYDKDLEAAARHLEHAVALEPANPEILLMVARLVANFGRLDEAIAIGEYVVNRDPVNPVYHESLGFTYLRARRLDEAIASFRTALTLSPGYRAAHFRIGEALLFKGESQAALVEMQQEQQQVPKRLEGEAMAYHALGQAVASNAALAELIDKYEHGEAYNIAYVLAFRGEADRAFAWLDKAVQYNDAGLSQVVSQLEFTNIHDDPRWLPFLESIGMSPEQLEAIDFKVTLPE
jgi:TolB-like protein/Tfp pilus assembly protein PilF